MRNEQRNIRDSGPVLGGAYRKSDPFPGICKIRGHDKGQINIKGSTTLQDRNLTSCCGSTSSIEFFAEAFGDVYTHGRNAKGLSSAAVKEYEKRQKSCSG